METDRTMEITIWEWKIILKLEKLVSQQSYFLILRPNSTLASRKLVSSISSAIMASLHLGSNRHASGTDPMEALKPCPAPN